MNYLVNKPIHNGLSCQRLLLFQEFEFEVVVQLGKSNGGTDHLSRIELGEEPMGIDDDFINTNIFKVEVVPEDLVEIAQFLQEGTTPRGYSKKKKKILAITTFPFTLINESL